MGTSETDCWFPVEGEVVRTSLIKLVALILACTLGMLAMIWGTVVLWKEGKLFAVGLEALTCGGAAVYFIAILLKKKSALVIGEECFQELIGDRIFAHVPYYNIATISIRKTSHFIHDRVVAIRLFDPGDSGTLILHKGNRWFDNTTAECECDFVIKGGYTLSLKAIASKLRASREAFQQEPETLILRTRGQNENRTSGNDTQGT